MNGQKTTFITIPTIIFIIMITAGFVLTAHGQFRPASGSLTITDTNTGDIIISTDDSNGIIGKSRSGTLEVIRG